MTTVLVLGAGGTLGARVTALLRREPGLRVVPASRRGAAALGAGARRADVRDQASLRSALEGVDLLVNAVGPYAYDPAPVVGACAAAGAHYADLAEDEAFHAALRRCVAARPAGRACFVPGCSTVPGLLDLLVRHAGGPPGEAWLSMGTRNRVSAPLLYGLLRPLGRPAPGGRFFRELRRGEIGGRSLCFGRHPSGLPGVRLYVGFDRALLVRGLVALAPAVARLSDAGLARATRALAPWAGLVRPLGTPRGALRVLGPRGSVEVEAAQSGLDVPAWPAVWLARRVAAGPAPAPGVRSLAELVPAETALAALRAAGFAVRVGLDGGPES